MKLLSEMSLQELWQLFPIVLTEHRTQWDDWYAGEARRLRALLPASRIVRLSHIGSTAIPGIWAKPIVDMLLETAPDGSLEALGEALCEAGYRRMSQSDGRLSLNRGYTERGFAERVFHLHVRHCGDHDELLFRDYLREHPQKAKEYEALKLSLWKPYEHDRDGYTAAKTPFIRGCMEEARRMYAGRYDAPARPE